MPDHTYECLDVEIAWNYGERDLKSEFSVNLSFTDVNPPFNFVYNFVLAGQTSFFSPKK